MGPRPQPPIYKGVRRLVRCWCQVLIESLGALKQIGGPKQIGTVKQEKSNKSSWLSSLLQWLLNGIGC